MGEITVILLLALIFLGPKKFPDLASGLGKLIREIRKATSDVKNEIALDDTFRKPFEELRDAVTLHPDELKRRDQLKQSLEDIRKRAEGGGSGVEGDGGPAGDAAPCLVAGGCGPGGRRRARDRSSCIRVIRSAAPRAGASCSVARALGHPAPVHAPSPAMHAPPPPLPASSEPPPPRSPRRRPSAAPGHHPLEMPCRPPPRPRPGRFQPRRPGSGRPA